MLPLGVNGFAWTFIEEEVCFALERGAIGGNLIFCTLDKRILLDELSKSVLRTFVNFSRYTI